VTALKGMQVCSHNYLVLFGCIFNYSTAVRSLRFRRGSVLLFIKYICLIKDLLTFLLSAAACVSQKSLRFTFSHFQVKIKQVLLGRGNQINSIMPCGLASRFSRVFFDVNAEELIEMIFAGAARLLEFPFRGHHRDTLISRILLSLLG
jgi:hypothetical protein